MKNAKVSFRVFDESGPLSLTWFPGPFGDASEAKNKNGVGFLGHNGDLLGVEFDDVNSKRDSQTLVFANYKVNIVVRDRQVSYSVTPLNSPKKIHRSSKKINAA